MDSAKLPIPLAEWLTDVAADAELRLDGFADATTSDGETLRYENESLTAWTAWSGHGRDGEVVVKNPDAEILSKMHAVAAALTARVLGDDGEEYDARGRVRV